MSTERPSPDALLARMRAEEAEQRRGKLKIFFGYAAGVGKTYAMLEAAQRERAEGMEVVVGYVEPHGRPDTEALLEGLEALPTREVQHKGTTLREFDLDAALARRPALLLVDELAHTNAEGLRHSKRWQDVVELLNAGVNVYTTLNVQHVESLNDVIAQITGVVVRETLPDSILERADEIELIDLTPEELIDRLKEGKVYLPQQAERALQNFFQKSNLQALRELSLRQAAHRLRRDVEAARHEKAATKPWATNERLLVCVGPSPTTAKLIRSAKRMAAAFGADWLAVAVSTPQGTKNEQLRQLLGQHMRMAEQLGGETHTLVGIDIARTILDYARTRNVTKIIVGKSAQPWWQRLLSRTVVDHLLDASGDIDVYVITGEGETTPEPRASFPRQTHRLAWSHYFASLLVVGICGFFAWTSHSLKLAEANTVMVFLFGVAVIALRFGRGPAIAASVLSVLAFDYFFVPPYYTFAISDAQYLVTFGVMLAIGIMISTLTSRMRTQLGAAQDLEARTAALLRLTRQMTEVSGPEFLIATAGKQLRDIFKGEVLIYSRNGAGPVTLRYGADAGIARLEINSLVAQWVADHDQVAGADTDTLPNATALFVPMTGSQRTLGAVGVRPADVERFNDPEQRRLLETCASLIALSLERDQSVLDATEAQARMQAEQMRSSLLSSVSHDLRTPLAAISGAAASLLAIRDTDFGPVRRELLLTIAEESRRMTRLVDNLLDMTRLESGTLAINQQWQVLEEIVGTALARLKGELQEHSIVVKIPADLPLIQVDGLLLEQVLVNLLENAARYTPAGCKIEVSASRRGEQMEIVVADNGSGVPLGSEKRIFEKFYRGPTAASDSRRGVGLGLAICEAIIRAHGGTISARNRPAGGAEFTIRLPCKEAPPQVVLDEVAAASSA